MSLFAGKIIPKSAVEIEKIRESSIIVSKTLALMAKMLKPGITGLELDAAAEQFILDQGGKPAFKGYRGFGYSLCISLNDAVVHGIPSDRPLKSGDVISVDCGVEKNGYFGDSAYTFGLGEIAPDVAKLIRVTHESLYKGLEFARGNCRIGDISFAIQQHTEKAHNYGVVRDLVGHGIGSHLHEPPDVPNFGKRGNGLKLQENWTIAVEPMINQGSREVYQHRDKWTILTRDKMPSAHFEHTVRIGAEKVETLSDHSFIETEIKNNPEIANISINI